MRRCLPVLLTLGLSTVALLGAGAGCAPSEEAMQEGQAAPGAAGPRDEMHALLADAADAAGARPAGDITWYTPENLYDYINGQAEQFREAGFVALAHAEVRAKTATGDAYVEVDLYRMTSAEAAGSVMDPPPPNDALDLAPGVQAYRAETLCEFVAGPYYVRISPRVDPAGQAEMVEALARSLAGDITAE